MPFDAEEFVRYRIANAGVRRHPFPHFFVQPVFPADYYAELLRRLPPKDWLKPIDDTGTVRVQSGGTGAAADAKAYPGRYIADVAELEEREQGEGGGGFWLRLSEWLTGDRFRALILEKFSADIAARFGDGAVVSTDIDARLVRDFTDYAIGPHTDSPRKLVSLLFYLPADDSLRELGTSIYAPKDPAFRCEGNRHHGFERFHRVASMPFVPNALFAFFKTDNSFHGLDPIRVPAVERNLLLYNIYVQGVARRPPGFRWPWRRGAQWTLFKAQRRR